MFQNFIVQLYKNRMYYKRTETCQKLRRRCYDYNIFINFTCKNIQKIYTERFLRDSKAKIRLKKVCFIK